MSEQPPSDWHAERLYVLRSIEELKTEQSRMREAEQIKLQRISEKAEKDIANAHEKIRAMDKKIGVLSLKNWMLAAALGGASMAALEVIRWVLRK